MLPGILASLAYLGVPLVQVNILIENGHQQQQQQQSQGLYCLTINRNMISRFLLPAPLWSPPSFSLAVAKLFSSRDKISSWRWLWWWWWWCCWLWWLWWWWSWSWWLWILVVQGDHRRRPLSIWSNSTILVWWGVGQPSCVHTGSRRSSRG